jgi:hypothetical protein
MAGFNITGRIFTQGIVFYNIYITHGIRKMHLSVNIHGFNELVFALDKYPEGKTYEKGL